MTAEEPTAAVMDALNQLTVPHMIVGSFSSNFYGIPRSTQDANIVVDLDGRPIAAIAERLHSAFRFDPQMGFEVVTGTIRHRFESTFLPFAVELYLLSNDPHDQERFKRRRPVCIFGRDTAVPTPEDVVITKMRWAVDGGRSKDRDDARNVIALQGDSLDWAYVERWCDRHGTRAALESIRASLGTGATR